MLDPEPWHVVERGKAHSAEGRSIRSDGDPSERWKRENVYGTYRKIDDEEKIKIQVCIY